MSFQSEKVLSFIPPDGNFRLMSYLIGQTSQVAIPVFVRHQLTFAATTGTGKLDISIGPKQTMGRNVSRAPLSCYYQKSATYFLQVPELLCYRLRRPR